MRILLDLLGGAQKGFVPSHQKSPEVKNLKSKKYKWKISPYFLRALTGDKLNKENACWSLPLLIMTLLILATVSVISPVSAQASDPPIQIHLTWGQNDTANTLVITWKTITENAGDIVRYGVKPGEYGTPVIGSHHTYSGAGGYAHDVELTGLSSNKVYYFICGGENGGWSSERKFRTAPDQRESFRFVAGGDSRSGAGDWPLGRDNISRTMAKFNPSFVLFTGDFTFNWNNQTEWDNWFAAVQEYWVDNNSLTIPIIPCIGNHEVYYPQPSDYDPETQATNYYGQFYLPGNERWYSLDWGPDLHIIVLDSEIRSSGADTWKEQLSWLENDLAAHASCRWKIAIFHRPPFTAGHYSRDPLTQGDFVPLFDNYHVDLVFSAHDHGYQRTYPINYNISENTPMPSPENGTVYVVSAGWDAPLYPKENRWWSAYFQSTYNFCVVDIFENGLLRLSAVDGNGNVFDEFSIQKAVPEVVEGISPLVIGAVAAAVTCAAVAFYLLKIRKALKARALQPLQV